MRLPKTQLSTDNGLRQKAINLFYLVFLILIFSFIPSEFVDSTFHANSSLDRISNEVNNLNNTNTKYLLHLLKDEPELLIESKNQLIRIERLTKITTNHIDKIKLNLISVNKIDKYGYFKFGKEETTSNEIMIYQKQADSLFSKLEAFKKTISDNLSTAQIEEINKILPLPKYELNSLGTFTEAADFYFKRAPLNVAVLNLSHFKSRVERIKVFVQQSLIKNILMENARKVSLDDFKIAENETLKDILGNSTLEEFFEKLKPFSYLEEKKENIFEKRNQYYIETLSDTIHPIGKAIQYYAHFDTTDNSRLIINVSSDDLSKTFTIYKPGPFIYFPNAKGRYTFTFSNGTKSTIKDITVIDAEPVIQNTRLSTLYIGLDNPLNIKTSEFDENDNLMAEITDGQVIKKGDIFYARVFKKGITQIKIFAEMPYGRIKVAEKSFVIRELHKPIPEVNGILSGGKVNKANVNQLQVMTLITDEYLVNEDVYIADFEFMMIYNNFNAVVEPISNLGSSFNNQILQTLTKASTGDIIIFSNIRTLSSRGVETTIPSLTITVN